MRDQTGLMRVCPDWVLKAKTPEERLRRWNMILLRQCAAWYHPSGAILALSRGLGLAPRTLGAYVSQNRLLTPELAIRIESLLGRHVVRREDFRPDLFLTGPDKETPGD